MNIIALKLVQLMYYATRGMKIQFKTCGFRKADGGGLKTLRHISHVYEDI